MRPRCVRGRRVRITPPPRKPTTTSHVPPPTSRRSDADDALGGAEGALFLRRSGLSNEQLREVWRLASGGTSKQKLDRPDWYVACKLVAATQAKGVEPSMMAVVGTEPLPLADFHYDVDPDVELDAAASEVAVRAGGAVGLCGPGLACSARVGGGGRPRLAPHVAPASDARPPVLPRPASHTLPRSPPPQPEAIRVTVGNPTAYGSGLAKHTRYHVLTNTELPTFPKKELAVWRRFSDFEWLHKRLSTVFPAAIIPLFPEKRMVGNSDDAFIAARCAALTTYVDKVAHHHALSASLDLLVFLDASDAGLEAVGSVAGLWAAPRGGARTRRAVRAPATRARAPCRVGRLEPRTASPAYPLSLRLSRLTPVQAKSYIEAVEAEAAESLLVKGVDMVMTFSGTQVRSQPV